MEDPKFVHGRLAEAVHMTGYSFERACRELKWLLKDNRWKQCGGGFERIEDFQATIDFSEFKIAIEQRKEIAQELAAIGASQRATARMLGIGEQTVARDLGKSRGAPNGAKTEESTQAVAPNGALLPFQHSAQDAAKLLDQKTLKTPKRWWTSPPISS